MYYDKYRSQVVVDPIDLYLIIAILSILVTKFVQSYFSEEKKMERLRQDIIRQSNLFQSLSPVTVKDTSLETRVMNPSTLSIRGGKLERLKNLKLLTTITKKIKEWINWLWFILYDPLTRGKSNIILDLLRFNLVAIIKIWGLNISGGGGIVVIHGPNLIPPVVYGLVTGPIVGFLGVGTTLALEFLMTALATKSVAQQITHNYRYKNYKGKIMDVIHETVTEESELKNKIYEIMEKAKKIGIEELHIEPSNCNIDLAPVRERTAEPFGIVNEMVKESNVSEIISESTIDIDKIIKESKIGEIINESSASEIVDKSTIDKIIKESKIGEIITESSTSPSLAERVKEGGRKTRYQTMQGLLEKLKKAEQLYDEYEEYMQPIRRVPPLKVE
jgi:hypothetical protein